MQKTKEGEGKTTGFRRALERHHNGNPQTTDPQKGPPEKTPRWAKGGTTPATRTFPGKIGIGARAGKRGDGKERKGGVPSAWGENVRNDVLTELITNSAKTEGGGKRVQGETGERLVLWDFVGRAKP